MGVLLAQMNHPNERLCLEALKSMGAMVRTIQRPLTEEMVLTVLFNATKLELDDLRQNVSNRLYEHEIGRLANLLSEQTKFASYRQYRYNKMVHPTTYGMSPYEVLSNFYRL